MSWFPSVSSLFSRARRGEGGTAIAESIEAAPPDGLAEIADGLQKLARVQARQGVRLEALENKIEGGFSDLRSVLQQAAAPRGPASITWDELLDAADALDEAERAAIADGNPAMAAGLSAVGTRIGRFLAQLGLRRERRVGGLPDPALVRVIGTIEAADVSEGEGKGEGELDTVVNEGQVVRVVRAAVMERGRLLREGEVLISRRPARSGQTSERKETNP